MTEILITWDIRSTGLPVLDGIIDVGVQADINDPEHSPLHRDLAVVAALAKQKSNDQQADSRNETDVQR